MKAAEFILYPVHKMLELPSVYAVNQTLGRPTTDRYRKLIAANVPLAFDAEILDLGCGLGAFRDCFPGSYTGIDINSAYVKQARALLSGAFAAMDCTSLSFSDVSFDEVVSIATTHHLNDEQIVMMVKEALRVCRPSGHLHVVDSILPLSPNLFKSVFFGLDRGRFPRKRDRLLAILRRAGNVERHEEITGPLHDVVYVRMGR
jgi:ubiquinone/menaquinone biosynthesis C-methylase UbiE